MKNLRSHTPKTTEEISATDLTKKLAAAYDGKSGAGIFLQILKEAEQAKRAGTLTDEEIDAFVMQFSPMLDEAQRKQLEQVVERLKGL